jgi:hypothetical protein
MIEILNGLRETVIGFPVRNLTIRFFGRNAVPLRYPASKHDPIPFDLLEIFIGEQTPAATHVELELPPFALQLALFLAKPKQLHAINLPKVYDSEQKTFPTNISWFGSFVQMAEMGDGFMGQSAQVQRIVIFVPDYAPSRRRM